MLSLTTFVRWIRLTMGRQILTIVSRLDLSQWVMLIWSLRRMFRMLGEFVC